MIQSQTNLKKEHQHILPALDSTSKNKQSVQFKDNRSEHTAQLKVRKIANPTQLQENKTGMPDNLKSGIENLSGLDMSDVKVHYNSSQPAQLQAHAFAQGNQIHLGAGQEKHLPHEAWHVVQQKQGRVQPTRQLKEKVNINDDTGLEKEADVMGAKALHINSNHLTQLKINNTKVDSRVVIQRNLVRDQDILDQRGTTFSWTPFRGKRDDEDISNVGKEEGRGARLDGVFAGGIKSEITWQPIDTVSKEGTGMTARIGPDHNLGSSPSVANALARVKAFAILSGKSYVSGHLLNEKLGGPGNDARNLTAFSGSANTLEASNIEKEVRDPVNNDGAWFHYSIGIEYTNAQKDYLSTDTKITKLPPSLPHGVNLEHLFGGNRRVKVRYASKLKAHWYQYNTDGNRHSAEHKKDINMASPLVGGASNLDDKGGPVNTQPDISSRGNAAKTTIQPEELVLTTSTLLKSVVENREGLIGLLKDLRGDVSDLNKTIESLELQAEESGSEILTLNNLLYDAGYDWGYANGSSAYEDGAYRYSYYEHGLEGSYARGYEKGYDKGYEETRQYHYGKEDGKRSTDLDENYHGRWFDHSYREGHADGVQEKNGYKAGYQAGFNDNYYFCWSANEHYKAGYENGYNKGYDESPFKKGNRPVFNGISLSSDKGAINSGAIETFGWGSTSVEITGEKYTKFPNTWYEVKIISSGDFGLSGYIGNTAWMKKQWIHKGQ